MAISRDDVLKIAALARLRLSEGEVERFAGQLSSILRHIDALSEADLEDAEEATGAADWPAPLRPDGGGAVEGAADGSATGMRGTNEGDEREVRLRRLDESDEGAAEMPDTEESDEGAARLRASSTSAGGPPDPLRRPLAELAPSFDDGFFTVPRLKALGEGRDE